MNPHKNEKQSKYVDNFQNIKWTHSFISRTWKGQNLCMSNGYI